LPPYPTLFRSRRAAGLGHPRHGLPHRRHPLGVGGGPAGRPQPLPVQRQLDRHRTGVHLDHQRQHGRHPAGATAHRIGGRRSGDPAEQPAHQARGTRLARLLGPRHHPGTGAHGLVRARRPHRSGEHRGALGLVRGSRRKPTGHRSPGGPAVTRRTLSRRSFLLATGASGAAVALSATSTTAWASSTPDLRVYVLVVDGCSPEEITPQLTPNLHRLRSCGTNYPQARSLPVMETIPNHVMMMSGVRPDRSGVPANSIYDREAGVVRTLDQPTDLRAPTLLDRLHDRGLVTGSVLSKEYLHGIFGDRATVRWEPDPVVPISGHAP